MGLRGPEHLYLMKEHFDQSINETEHLEYMESRGGNLIGLIVSLPNTSSLSIIGSTWFIIGWAPRSAYHLSYEVEVHASLTYAEYLTRSSDDKKICEIMNDEIQHFQELAEAIRLIDPDRLTIREKDLASVLDTSDLETAR